MWPYKSNTKFRFKKMNLETTDFKTGHLIFITIFYISLDKNHKTILF